MIRLTSMFDFRQLSMLHRQSARVTISVGVVQRAGGQLSRE